eukprot:gnl/TRDRNA2_/TRDRNA2_148380_c1_seq1.p1 gnl/TRDRNA2_/TRDRNA2_148380_c1~~gnl/TRDRNA2_/TRDRNA2_148380_c1_seq1.p1  ORF type:complete len:245 (-),score=44.46 gnl/TRDRNA2_/TRDRNA2_148380_c1_seq1:44-778(-)
MVAIILVAVTFALSAARGSGRGFVALRTNARAAAELTAAAYDQQVPMTTAGPHYAVVGSPMTTYSPMMTTHYYMAQALPPVYTSSPPPTTTTTTTTTTTPLLTTTMMLTTTAPPPAPPPKVISPPPATHAEVAALREEIKELRSEVKHGNEDMWNAARLIATTVDKDEKEMKAVTRDIQTLRGRQGGGMPLVLTECSSRQSSCGECVGSPSCVWCAVENRCYSGDESGPVRGECAFFKYGMCGA